MSTFIAVSFAVLGVVLLLSGVLSIAFRKRLTANMVASGTLSGLSRSASLAGWIIGLMQLAVAAGAFLLAVYLPRKMGGSQLDSITARAISALGGWAIPLSTAMAVVGVLQCVAAIALLNSSWRRREAWKGGVGLSGIPGRDRVLLYSGAFLLVCSPFFLGCGVILLAASLA